jgi:hypothetical protein
MKSKLEDKEYIKAADYAQYSQIVLIIGAVILGVSIIASIAFIGLFINIALEIVHQIYGMVIF